MAKRKTGGFRFNAKKVGLTYSCPVEASENPVPDATSLRDTLFDKVGFSKYVVAQEDQRA